MSRRNEEHGFTLIELLVVVIIIGMLAAIAIPAYLEQRKNAYFASVKNDLRTAVVAIESTAFETGDYLALDGANETTLAFITRGYEGSDNTSLLVRATATSYCVEAKDLRATGEYLVARNGVPGFETSTTGC